MLWYGSVASIPSGWTLCDGTMGTPDLTDRFVVGAGGDLLPDGTGGSLTQTHTFTTDGHYHTLLAGAYIQPGINVHSRTDIRVDTGTTDPADNRPPYYALCYIMKL